MRAENANLWMRVFVRVGDLTIRLTNECDTSLGSWVHGAKWEKSSLKISTLPDLEISSFTNDVIVKNKLTGYSSLHGAVYSRLVFCALFGGPVGPTGPHILELFFISLSFLPISERFLVLFLEFLAKFLDFLLKNGKKTRKFAKNSRNYAENLLDFGKKL